MILQFCRCGGLFDAKGHPDGFLSHFPSLRNFRLGRFFDSLRPASAGRTLLISEISEADLSGEAIERGVELRVVEAVVHLREAAAQANDIL